MQFMMACLLYFVEVYHPTNEIFCAITSSVFFPLKDQYIYK